MSDTFDDTAYKLLDNCDLLDSDIGSNPCDLLDQHYHHLTTGLVHSVMTRTSAKKFSYAIQIPAMDGKEPYNKQTFSGLQESRHSFAIFESNSEGGHVKIGSLHRVQMNMYSISYMLKNTNEVPMSIIVYHVPSPIKVLRTPPSRYAEVALYTPPSILHDTNHMKQYGDTRNDKSKKQTRRSDTVHSEVTEFGKLCLKSIKKCHNLTAVVGVDPSITVLQSLKPYINPRTGRSTLHFNGRGKFASPKNMKLVVMNPLPSGTKKGTSTVIMDGPPPTAKGNTSNTLKVTLQFCKWDDDAYHIDYNTPITPLHAFAFGLAQINL